MASLAEHRRTPCPLDLTTSTSSPSSSLSSSSSSSSISSSTGEHCFRLQQDDRPRSTDPPRVMSSRLSRDLEELNSFLEDVEARSASIQPALRRHDGERTVSPVEGSRLKGEESATGDYRTREEERIRKDGEGEGEGSVESSETPGKDVRFRVDGCRGLVRGSVDATRSPAKVKTGRKSVELSDDIDGIVGGKWKDSGNLRWTRKDNGDLRGARANNGDLRGTMKDNGDPKGTNKVVEESSSNRRLRNVTKYLRNEATPAGVDTKVKREDTEKPNIFPTTGEKTTLVRLTEDPKGAVRYRRTLFPAEYEPSMGRRDQCYLDTDPKQDAGDTKTNRDAEVCVVPPLPFLSPTNSSFEDDSRSDKSMTKRSKWNVSEAVRHRDAFPEDAPLAVVAADDDDGEDDCLGVKSVPPVDRLKDGASGSTISSISRPLSVSRRFCSTGMLESLRRGESGAQLSGSTVLKRDMGRGSPQRIVDQEEKVGECGVGSTGSLRLRAEPEDWRNLFKRRFRIKDELESAVEVSERKTEVNVEVEEEAAEAEKKTMEKRKQSVEETKEDTETEKDNVETKDKVACKTLMVNETVGSENGNMERKVEINNMESHGKASDRSENVGLDRESEEDSREDHFRRMSQRWMGIVSEYAVLLTGKGTGSTRGVSGTALFRLLKLKVDQFEADYRRLVTGKEINSSNHITSTLSSSISEDDDSVDEMDNTTLQSMLSKLKDDFRRLAARKDQNPSSVQDRNSSTYVTAADDDDDEGERDVNLKQREVASEGDGDLEPKIQQHHHHQHQQQQQQQQDLTQKMDECQSLHVSWSSSERSPTRGSPDIQKASSDVTLSRSGLTKQVTDQDRDGVGGAGGGYKDVADVGCTRSDRSVGRLTPWEKHRYIHPLEQFETDTRAEHRSEEGDRVAADGRRQRMDLVVHGDSASKTFGDTAAVEKETDDDDVMLSRILCENIQRDDTISVSADPSTVLYAYHNKPPGNKKTPPRPPSRTPGAAAQAEGRSPGGQRGGQTPIGSRPGPPVVERRSPGDATAKRRPSTSTACQLPCRTPPKRAFGAKVTATGATSSAAEVRPSLEFPRRILRTSDSASAAVNHHPPHPSGASSVAAARRTYASCSMVAESSREERATQNDRRNPRRESSSPDRPPPGRNDQRVWNGRGGAAPRPFDWRSKGKTLAMEAGSDQRNRNGKRNRTGDSIKNRRPDGGDAFRTRSRGADDGVMGSPRSGNDSYTVLLRNESYEVLARARRSQESGAVRSKDRADSSPNRPPSEGRVCTAECRLEDGIVRRSEDRLKDGMAFDSEDMLDNGMVFRPESRLEEGMVRRSDNRQEDCMVLRPESMQEDGMVRRSPNRQADGMVRRSPNRQADGMVRRSPNRQADGMVRRSPNRQADGTVRRSPNRQADGMVLRPESRLEDGMVRRSPNRQADGMVLRPESRPGDGMVRRSPNRQADGMVRRSPNRQADGMVFRPKSRLENGMVCRSDNKPEDGMVRTDSRRDEDTACSKVVDPDTHKTCSKIGSEYRVKVSAFVDRDTFERPRRCDRCLGRTSGASGAFGFLPRRSRSHDRFHQFDFEPFIEDIRKERFIDSSDVDSDERCLLPFEWSRRSPEERGREVEERLGMFETGEGLRGGRSADPRRLLFPEESTADEEDQLSKSIYDPVDTETDVGYDEEEDDDDHDEDESCFFDSFAYWSDGDVCEKLLLTESDEENQQQRQRRDVIEIVTGTTPRCEPDVDLPLDLAFDLPEQSDLPEQAIIYVIPHRVLLTTTEPPMHQRRSLEMSTSGNNNSIEWTPVNAMPESSPREAGADTQQLVPRSGVRQQQRRRRGFYPFRLIRRAFVGLNRRLRPMDIGIHQMDDLRGFVAIIFILIVALLFLNIFHTVCISSSSNLYPK